MHLFFRRISDNSDAARSLQVLCNSVHALLFVAKCELSKKVKFSDSCNNNKTVDESKCNVYGGNTGEVSSLTYKQVLVRDNVRKL